MACGRCGHASHTGTQCRSGLPRQSPPPLWVLYCPADEWAELQEAMTDAAPR